MCKNMFLSSLITLGIVTMSCNREEYGKWVDSTSRKEWYGGYALGRYYRTMTPTFITKYSLEAPHAERRAYDEEGFPRTVEQYVADPGKWPKIIGIAPQGTVIRIVGLKSFHSTEFFSVSVQADVDVLNIKGIGIIGLSQHPPNETVVWEPISSVLDIVPATSKRSR